MKIKTNVLILVIGVFGFLSVHAKTKHDDVFNLKYILINNTDQINDVLFGTKYPTRKSKTEWRNNKRETMEVQPGSKVEGTIKPFGRGDSFFALGGKRLPIREGTIKEHWEYSNYIFELRSPHIDPSDVLNPIWIDTKVSVKSSYDKKTKTAEVKVIWDQYEPKQINYP